MNKYQLMHSTGLIVSVALIGLMLVSRLDGQTGDLTDLAIVILVVACGWHIYALRRITRRSNT